MDKTFSLLWPDHNSRTTFSLSKQVIDKFDLKELLNKHLYEQLDFIPTELEVINYRHEVIKDLQKYPSIIDLMQNFCYSFDKITEFYNILKDLSIKSSALINFKNILLSIIESDIYLSFQEESASIKKKGIKSITINFDMDDNMNPVCANLLSVNNEKQKNYTNMTGDITSSNDVMDYISNVCSIMNNDDFVLKGDYETQLIELLPNNIVDELSYYATSVKLDTIDMKLSNEKCLNLVYGSDYFRNNELIKKQAMNQLLYQLGLYYAEDLYPVDGIYLYASDEHLAENEFSQDFFKINQLIKNASESSLILINNSFSKAVSTVNLLLIKSLLRNIAKLNCRALVTTSYTELADLAKDSNMKVGAIH